MKIKTKTKTAIEVQDLALSLAKGLRPKGGCIRYAFKASLYTPSGYL